MFEYNLSLGFLLKKEGSLSKRIILKKIKNFENWKMCDVEDQDQDDIFEFVNDSVMKGMFRNMIKQY